MQEVSTLLQCTRCKIDLPSKHGIVQEVKYASRQECSSMQKVKYAVIIISDVCKK